ncbi:MAG: arylsulfotransferase family protein [Solirubrobacteraceae bacterium]
MDSLLVMGRERSTHRRARIGTVARSLAALLSATTLLAFAAPASGHSAGTARTLSFHSAPGLHPPVLTITGDPDRSAGDIFLTPIYLYPGDDSQVGPMILDSRGRVVWFRPLDAGSADNLQVQSYRGRPVLTWWHGYLDEVHGTIFGVGHDVIMDSSYRRLATLPVRGGYPVDLHEFQITPRGTALLDEYVPVHVNLSRKGGPSNAAVLDCVVQEVDIPTGKVLWEWHSVGHVPITASELAAPQNVRDYFDYFHINSIQQLPNGNLVISARNTWGIYEISRKTGKVIWTLGGKRSSFHMGQGTNFEWQHDARMHPDGTLSLFNDASLPQEERQGSAKVLKVNTKTMTVRLVRRVTHNPPLLPGLAGNAQVLPNHNIFVGWGGSPEFSEYTPQGRQIFNGSFQVGVLSYRALRAPWTGHPLTRPAMASVLGSSGEITVYASWNGATQVARWRVLAGPTPHALSRIGFGKRRRDFETAIHIRTGARYLAVQALDSHGHVLGTSRPAKRPSS